MEFALKDMKERFAQAYKRKAALALISGNHDTWRIANYLDDKGLRLFYMMLYTLPGIPFVLYGDEIGMKTSDICSKDGGYQRTGTRIPMVWNSEEPHHGFCDAETEPYLPFNDENKTSVEDSIKEGNSLRNYIRSLAQLRKNIKDLTDPEMEIREKDRILTFTRGEYLLVVNMSQHDYEIKGDVVFSSVKLTEKLPPRCSVLLHK
jgi:maltose alpha-D-glucosyltransferase/alpha-amylase